jgi:hypothetical protein
MVFYSVWVIIVVLVGTAAPRGSPHFCNISKLCDANCVILYIGNFLGAYRTRDCFPRGSFIVRFEACIEGCVFFYESVQWWVLGASLSTSIDPELNRKHCSRQR